VAVKVNNWLEPDDGRQLGSGIFEAPAYSATVTARDPGSGIDNRDSGVAATGSAVRDPGLVIEVRGAPASATWGPGPTVRDPGPGIFIVPRPPTSGLRTEMDEEIQLQKKTTDEGECELRVKTPSVRFRMSIHSPPNQLQASAQKSRND
jgi:hypothetical protein